MAERRRYFEYSLSPSKPIPSRSLRRYKVHVVGEESQAPLSPELITTSPQITDSHPRPEVQVQDHQSESWSLDSMPDNNNNNLLISIAHYHDAMIQCALQF